MENSTRGRGSVAAREAARYSRRFEHAALASTPRWQGAPGLSLSNDAEKASVAFTNEATRFA